MVPLASAITSNPFYNYSAAGLIVTLATSNINTLADLKGKIVASANPLYQEGVHFQMGVMQDAGVSLLEAPLQVILVTYRLLVESKHTSRSPRVHILIVEALRRWSDHSVSRAASRSSGCDFA
jgi:hypothetical protein